MRGRKLSPIMAGRSRSWVPSHHQAWVLAHEVLGDKHFHLRHGRAYEMKKNIDLVCSILVKAGISLLSFTSPTPYPNRTHLRKMQNGNGAVVECGNQVLMAPLLTANES